MGWQDGHSPAVARLGRRVSHVTGLNTDTRLDDAELLQVANYMNGGHYNPHHDYVMREKSPEHVSARRCFLNGEGGGIFLRHYQPFRSSDVHFLL